MSSGIAKALTQQFPLKASQWPRLTFQLGLNRIQAIDIGLAEMLLKRCSEQSEAVAFLLCHLALAQRQGHACIAFDHRDGSRIAPSVRSCWSGDHMVGVEEVLSYHEEQMIEALVLEGFQQLPEALIDKVLKLEKGRLYFQRYWHAEQELLRELQRLQSATPLLSLEKVKMESELQLMAQKGTLQPEQLEAIQAALNANVFFLSGGPGTGKTFTSGQLIRLFWTALSVEERATVNIALAAPTGKAAAALQSSLTRALQDLPEMPNLSTQTLHALLGIKFNRTHEVLTKLSTHLVLVDESSMIDMELFTALLKAIPAGARVIFLGDPYQLPPIDVGSPFADLVHASPYRAIAHTALKKCLRAELKEIVTVAEHIRTGQANEALEMLCSGEFPAIQLTAHMGALPELCHYAKAGFPKADLVDQADLIQLLRNYQHFRLLSPMRKGVYGVESVNVCFLRALVGKVSRKRTLALPIIMTRNDAQAGVFNGECGLWIKSVVADEDLHKVAFEDTLILPDPQQAGSLRSLPALLAPAFELAYCLSVHKSQGSEFERVLLLLPSGSEHFGREMLYTAVTRAKRELEIWSQSEEMVERVIRNSTQRVSGLTVA